MLSETITHHERHVHPSIYNQSTNKTNCQTGKSVEHFLADWKNERFDGGEKDILSSDLGLAATQHNFFNAQTDAIGLQFHKQVINRDMLSRMRVLSQVDDKFILTTVDSVL